MARLLIVDDEPAIRDAARAVLEGAGHTVTEEPDGLMVTASVAETRPDVVIIDMGMPGKDGLETIIALRREHPTLKILAISGGRMLEAARRLGADAILEKPFRAAELRTAVAALLR